MTKEDANLDYVNQCLERGVTDFTEIDRAFDAGYDKGYQYAIEKACKWLETHILHAEADGYMTTYLFKQFKQFMEE